MIRNVVIVLIAIALAGCAKDEIIDPSSSTSDLLSQTVASVDEQLIISDQFAIAGVLPRLSDEPQREPLIL